MPDYASWPRRIVALVIDWTACTLVAVALLGGHRYSHDRGAGWLPLAIFLFEAGLGTALVGGSFGQLMTRIRVLHTNGRPLSLLAALLRSLLVCLVIPPLVFRSETGRGLHDLATDAAAYRI
ncbi:MAG: RDD family protein [Actinomycetota bacterium]|nr:RDD family protein [Actinomycetota bacterium]